MPERIALHYRPGNHDPITPQHIQSNLDWFDWAFGRGDAKRSAFPERLLHHFDWHRWKAAQPPGALAPPSTAASWKHRVRWSLGNQPGEFSRPAKVPLTILPEEEYGVAEWSRDRWKPEGVT
ncbi:MAG: hypothetical protein GWO24_29640, partial [Akkermansiaceae bacterium]|nr:hypothetical protein [Akkermansiaceae bacterium]